MPVTSRAAVPGRVLRRVVGGLLVLGLASLPACAGLADTRAPAVDASSARVVAATPAPAALTGGLLSVELVGGMCPSGHECSYVVTLDADGRWRSEDETGAVQNGQVDDDVVAQVAHAVRVADRADLTARAFTGECERHMDGTEVVLTIRPGEADELVLPGCTYVLPRSGPLIEAAVLVRALG